MAEQDHKAGRKELRDGLKRSRSLFLIVALFSVFANLLMLTGPLFMLQVYDRVLASQSEATLVALTGLVVLLYGLMAVLDYARGRILARIGARFQTLFDKRVFDAVMRRSVDPGYRNRPATSVRDLESIQRVFSSPAAFAVYDIPWTPIFLAAIFIFHPLLGWFAVAGGTILILATLLNQWITKRPQEEYQKASAVAENFQTSVRRDAEVVQSLGMRKSVLARWQENRNKALESSIYASDVGGTIQNFTKAFRFLLQSGMLAIGAWLVLQQELTPGAMIAGSILLGRALAPVEQSIAQWPLVQRARSGWAALAEILERIPEEQDHTALPKPKAKVEVLGVSVTPPGERTPTLRNVSFRLEPGQALGVIGPSAAGKSTLARALTGIWPTVTGSVRIDGAALDQFADDVRGEHIGYLPQDVALFDASVADNIARLSTTPDAEQVVIAAKKAGAHEMILKLPEGYDTRISAGGSRLSGGQKQRLGLARAMYGDPVLIVLDEPNANLDSSGSAALNAAIDQMKAAGKAVIIMAHRPAAIASCDLLLVLDQGMAKAFGPRDDVLKETLKNYKDVAPNIAAGAPGTAQRLPQGAAMPTSNPIKTGGTA
jgi:PrtD family type I secretion system ABC transporter